MNNNRVNYSPKLIPYMVEKQLWGKSDFSLLDVGASGGIEACWKAFEPKLKAVGFEPLLAETARLNKENQNEKFEYEAAFLGCESYDELFPKELRQDHLTHKYYEPFGRCSAMEAMRLKQQNYIKEVFNKGQELKYSEEHTSIDDYIEKKSISGFDFIKTDTDGSDLQVLMGASGLLESGAVLALQVEANFHGGLHPYQNCFSNIDRFLRKHGFQLYELDVHRYSRKELPLPFACGIAAQTVQGQVEWADALYIRDLASPDYTISFPTYLIDAEKVLKLACIFELFNLPDCAAELLLRYKELLGKGVDLEHCLNLLTPELAGRALSYDKYLEEFRKNPEYLFPNNLAKLSRKIEASENQSLVQEAKIAAGREALEQALVERQSLANQCRDLQIKLDQAWQAYHSVESEHKRLLESKSWKVTEPVRKLASFRRSLK